MTDEKPTVIEALSKVMGDVQAVGKESRNSQQGYAFRGVDAVMNAVGPALRRHGVVIDYHGSRRDLNGAQVTWIIHKLAELPDHESETPNESR